MAKTPKYPNPKFFKAKDNIDWKKQWENLKVCGRLGRIQRGLEEHPEE